METAIAISKYTGMILSGVFGVFGLLVKFRDARGKITRAGRTALILIVVSTLVALSSQTFEMLRSRREHALAAERQARDTLEAVQRTEKMLSEINRGLHPITEISAGFSISVHGAHPQMKAYIARLRKEAVKVVSDLKSGKDVLGIVPNTEGDDPRNANYESLSFVGSSSLAPKKNTEEVAFLVLNYATVELEFYVNPTSRRSHERPDLQVSVFSTLDKGVFDQGHSVEYDIGSSDLTINLFMLKSDRRSWQSSGRIVGLPDLLGSQMVVRLRPSIGSSDPSADHLLFEIRQLFELESLLVSIPGQPELWFERGMLEKVDENDCPTYIFNFPKTMDELEKLRP